MGNENLSLQLRGTGFLKDTSVDTARQKNRLRGPSREAEDRTTSAENAKWRP